jgi:hypothetical protein
MFKKLWKEKKLVISVALFTLSIINIFTGNLVIGLGGIVISLINLPRE